MSLDSRISDVVGAIGTAVKSKQDVLVSGTNIKTVNGTSILGTGDIQVSGGSGSSNVIIQENEPDVTEDSLWIRKLPNGKITMFLKEV